jgi:hypothetical protein
MGLWVWAWLQVQVVVVTHPDLRTGTPTAEDILVASLNNRVER